MQDSESSEWNKSVESRNKKAKKFKCQCGKVYQTAGKLVSHVKMYHNGVPPVPARNEEKPVRGRPKQYQYKQLRMHEDKVNPLLELKIIEPSRSAADTSAKEIYEKQPVFRLINRYMEQPDSQTQPKFNQKDKVFEVTLGNGLAILIRELEEIIESKELIHQLTLLITIYISYVIQETQDQNVLNNGSVGLLPEFANLFILYDLSKRCERLKLMMTWLGKPGVVLETLNILFRWLAFKQFTHTKAIPNEDFLKREETTQL